ncbi:MAG: cation-translocating P-type ATPase C-terminal domain-containing protein, partial [Bacteroidales bacterium]
GKFFGGGKILITCMQGVSILLIVLGVYFIGLHKNYSEEAVRTMSFITLIVSNLLTIQTNRSWEKNIFQILATPNKSVKWIVSLAIVILTAVLFIPFLRGMFSFAPLGMIEILVSGAVGCLSIVWFEIYKATKRKSSRAVSGF